VPGTNPALQTWNGQNFVVADGSAQNRISLPFLQVNSGAATYVVGADNNGFWSYYNPQAANYLAGGSAGQIPWQSAPNATAFTATGTSGQLLQSGATASPTWITPSNLSVIATGSTTTRTLANRFSDIINVKDFGAVGDGVADDTAAIQSAINQAQIKGSSLYLPAGIYRTTATINITAGVDIFGDSPKNISQSSLTLKGTWFYINHNGRGFYINSSFSYMSGVNFYRVGTYRDQPNPAPGWTPINNDYDFSFYNVSDVVFQEVMLLNPTNGIYYYGGGFGRLNVYNLRMQPFNIGIQIDNAQDVCRFDQIQIWPFWSTDSNVISYQIQNLSGFYLARLDNSFFSNVFVFGARAGFRFFQNVYGTTNKIKVDNADFDQVTYGFWVDSTVVGSAGPFPLAVKGQFSNITHQSGSLNTGSNGIKIDGNTSILYFSLFRTDLCKNEAVYVAGVQNALFFVDSALANWDQSQASYSAVNCLNGNYVYFNNKPLIIKNGVGGVVPLGASYSSTGFISSDDWRSYTPTITTSSGTITTLGAVTGKYKIVESTVTVENQIAITTNGTGAGTLFASIPTSTQPSNVFVGSGREITLSGKSLTATLSPGGSNAQIVSYDNSYPGASGANILVTYIYNIPNLNPPYP
jgi:hypothetical protein